jgi:ribosomal protein S18 acetylase RimI-like enzyme
MDGLIYSRDRASVDDIADHLRICSDYFRPPLSDRVNVVTYSLKIRNFANTFEAWFDRQLVGLVAAYQNTEAGEAFVTSVSTDSRYKGKGIGSRLLFEMIEFYGNSGISKIELEVNGVSDQAISLYSKIGFKNDQPDIYGVIRMTFTIDTFKGNNGKSTEF